MTMRILVSDDVSEKGVALLREHFDVDVKTNLPTEELLKIIGEYDGLVTRSQTQVTKDVIDAAKNLKVIGRAGVGVDNIDIPAATARGIVVLNAPEGNTIAATEHTIAMMMAMTRHIPQAHASIQAGKWDRKSFDGIQVQGKTLGIIGVGRIGSRVALRMQAMEMTTIGYDPYITEERAHQVGVDCHCQNEGRRAHCQLCPRRLRGYPGACRCLKERQGCRRCHRRIPRRTADAGQQPLHRHAAGCADPAPWRQHH